MPDEIYLGNMTVKDTLSMLVRCHTELHDIVMILQNRVLALEIQVRCNHLFKSLDTHDECSVCGQQKGF